MTKIRISTISYTNTKPFVYGMLAHPELLEKARIIFDTPAEAARKLLFKESDLGIIPVAMIPGLPESYVLSDYCIGADGPVNSVFIFSELPIGQVRSIRLDTQSRTSNNLARVLCRNFWKTDPVFLDPESPMHADAIVLIGDRTFLHRDRFAFHYDLSGEWKDFTGLPFVFAAWVANKELEPAFIFLFNEAIKFGVDHIEDVLAEIPAVPGFDLRDYLLHKLSFTFDAEKRKGLELFLSYLKELETERIFNNS